VIEPVSHAIDANGLRIVVHRWGGDGSPVLLAHPTGFHGRVWASVAEQLVARGREVWSFDFRGHGDSDVPSIESESYSWKGFADDVLAVTRHLDLAGRDDLLACGHSKGGAALLIAEQEAPATYTRMWTYEPIMFLEPSPVPDDDFVLARSARKRRNEWSSIDEAYDSYASKLPLADIEPETLRAYVEHGLRDRGDGVYELKCPPEVEAQMYAMGPGNNAYGRLGEVAAVVRIVCGETSSDITPAFGAKIAARLPHGSFEVMPGQGHFGPHADTDATVASMLRFATETGAATRA
jgi:pimeloyl-ACP methyl ester carboxylesterase